MFFNDFLITFFIYIYVKMSKDSSPKFYQNNKEKIQKKAREDIKVFIK